VGLGVKEKGVCGRRRTECGVALVSGSKVDRSSKGESGIVSYGDKENKRTQGEGLEKSGNNEKNLQKQ